MSRRLWLLLSLASFAAAAEVAVPVTNPSFESPATGATARATDGWTITRPGVECIRAGHKATVAGTTAGRQFLRFGVDGQGGVVEQSPAGVTVKPGAYKLSFLVNRVFNDSKMTRPLTAELLGGGTVLDALQLGVGDIPDADYLHGGACLRELTAHVPPDSPAAGKPLTIRFTGGAVSGFGMTGIDEVRVSHDADAKRPALYQLDTTATEPRSTEPLPGMGGTGRDGTRYGVDGERWTRNGQPWFPVSGEFHYARYPEAEWGREMAKMRALGVDIVATYVFWNHHETAPGKWDWSGRLDLRRFIQTARDNGLLVWLRLGPYINAEAKNGGIPDFANKGKRSNSPDYLPLVEKYYGAVAAQLQGQFVKDGGPIVGIQLDNEFASGDPKHITRLKEIATVCGMGAPYWTVTANSRFERMTAIPLQGSYTYRGWEGGGGTQPTSGFSFSTDEWTANTDLGGTFYDTKDYPRGFCELGTGSPMNGGSRFIVEPDFVLAQAWDCVGRGTNYLGYYMFHGGTQTAGFNGGPWPLTYDFQAPLGEFGQVRESGRQYRRLHTFVREFAAELTAARAVRDPRANPDPKQTTRLRHIGRFKDGRGFWFVNNTQRNLAMPARHDVQVVITLPDHTTLTVPATPQTMPDRRHNVFPVRLDLGGVELLWATVQPLARLTQKGVAPVTIFWLPDWTDRTLAFPAGVKITVESGSAKVAETDGGVRVTAPAADDRVALLATKGDATVRILLITDADSRNATVTPLGGRKRLVITRNCEVAGIQPLRIQGQAGQTGGVEIYPADGLTAAVPWQSATITAASWAHFKTTFAAAPPAPALTKDGADRWIIGVRSAADLTSLAHAWLEFPYRGSEAQLLLDGKPVTNDFHHGLPWLIDLRRHAAACAASRLALRITGPGADPGTAVWLPQREVRLGE